MHLFTLASAGTGMADSFRFYILGRLPFRQMVNIAETMSLGILLVDEGLVPPVILF